jgi:hypothetical protein
MTRLMIVTLLVIMLTACQPITPQPTETPQPTKPSQPLEMPLATAPLNPVKQTLPVLQPNAWSIRMTLSGGIMGLHRTLEITSDGQVTAVDERSAKKNTIQLAADELSKLQTLIADSSFAVSSLPTGCADCFIYNVEISSGKGKPFTVQVDDTNINTSGMGPLVRYLSELLGRALKPQ